MQNCRASHELKLELKPNTNSHNSGRLTVLDMLLNCGVYKLTERTLAGAAVLHYVHFKDDDCDAIHYSYVHTVPVSETQFSIRSCHHITVTDLILFCYSHLLKDCSQLALTCVSCPDHI